MIAARERLVMLSSSWCCSYSCCFCCCCFVSRSVAVRTECHFHKTTLIFNVHGISSLECECGKVIFGKQRGCYAKELILIYITNYNCCLPVCPLLRYAKMEC